jgi:AraC-like DNA-binding protein
MVSLAENIIAYANYLKKQYNLSLSYHFRTDISAQLGSLGYTRLLSLSKHTNPYCMHIKLSKNLSKKCIECQQKVIAKCAFLDRFTGVCHAGVLEYVYGIKYKNKVFGFISVSGFRGESNKSFRDKKLQEVFEKSLSPSPVPKEFLDMVVPPLAFMLAMLCRELENIKPKDSMANEEKNNFQLILHYVRERHNNVCLEDIACEFNYSKSYISHMFKKVSGYSLSQYCNMLKIEDAKELLKNTNYSITDIAHAVGFGDFSYFIKVFKQQTGKTPLKWKKSAGSKL